MCAVRLRIGRKQRVAAGARSLTQVFARREIARPRSLVRAEVERFQHALPSARMDQADFDKQAKLTLLGRGTSPEEISAAVKFILSQPALTGQMIALDGGQHLVWQTPDVTEVNE